ncbi:MAG TPA: SRPBCC domain-containing protein [Dehalococcoidia bacterium]|nr:SRPBCC domain-containing protein [Dehalococcoidia bacterium]
MTQSDSGETRIEGERLVIERVVEAPRELVWSAWTEPEQFTRWYGPAGMSLDVCEIDFRVGGSHLFGMRMPDGGAYFTTGIYSEIVPVERFVTTDSPADERGELVSPAFETVVTVELAELADGQSRLTLEQAGWPDEGMAAGAAVGWNQALDKLADALASA